MLLKLMKLKKLIFQTRTLGFAGLIISESAQCVRKQI